MPALPGKPAFWLGAVGIWFLTLWVLSSSTHPGIPTPDIRFFDKIEHFGYFFGGGGLVTAWLFRRNPLRPLWPATLPTSVAILLTVGAVDEFHQTFVPGRSGNDPFDLLADLVGAVAGSLVFLAIHRKLKWLS